MAGASNIDATDSETLAYLRDPASGIPYDVHFEIEDEEGCSLGMIGGHKAIFALKSPVFKAMLFGPLAETSDPIKIRKTSMFAFKEMLVYIHDAKMDWRPWSLDLRELFRMADLAERYNLPGLTERIVAYAKGCLYPKERLLEIARLAEDFHMFTGVSEALLVNCAFFLTTILETPEVHNKMVKEWSVKDAEEMGTALRLLARVDRSRLSYVISDDIFAQRVISHIRHIDLSIQSRPRLQELKTMLEENPTETADLDLTAALKAFSYSLRICLMKDEEKAALDGAPLTLDTIVEDGFTHADSVRLHLDTISLVMKEAEEMLEKVLVNEWIDELWKTMFDAGSITIPGAKSITLSWLSSNPDIIDRDYLAEKLRSSTDNVKELPEYNDACDVYM